MQHGSAEQVEYARVRRLFQILILSAPLVGEYGESSGVKNLELLQRVESLRSLWYRRLLSCAPDTC